MQGKGAKKSIQRSRSLRLRRKRKRIRKKETKKELIKKKPASH